MKIVCIIQARTTSSRLPNKVLLPLPFLGSTSVLEQVVHRVQKATRIDEVVLATTTNASDDPIMQLANKIGLVCYRGSEDHVLQRYYEAAKHVQADLVVRVTSDCPCIDPHVLDAVVEKHLREQNDYTSNNRIPTFPHGLDLEVFTFDALETAYRNATLKIEIEHVTPYIYKTHAQDFTIGNLENTVHTHNLRVTLDTPQDYTLLCALFDLLPSDFGKDDIETLFESKPWLSRINQEVDNKVVCSSLQEELQEAKRLLQKQDLHRVLAYLKEFEGHE
ncbi:MAG: cytidylyltransferase domain-containing protein [Erysipelotrichaceae bacterium]